MATYVLVHGAWHSGELLEPVAELIREMGHEVHCPTLAGNGPGDSKSGVLEDAISGLVDFFKENNISDAIVMGHSYGGMVITGLADHCPDRVKRLIYWNAYVPNDGESLNDLIPDFYIDHFEHEAEERGDNSITMDFLSWREMFIGDGTAEQARESFEKLNPHPYGTFSQKISLKKNPAEMEIGKSYLNCTEDNVLPFNMMWHPHQSEKLGVFSVGKISGGLEVCFTNPGALANAIIVAGRD